VARHLRGWLHVLAGALFGVLVPGGAWAQNITIDGTLSEAKTLVGPNYAITANLGKQIGGNLFHSFGKFGLSQGESANFSGPNTVTNIVGRVTGGSQSSIYGKIQSSIAGANLYLINPSGMVFGPHATVSVSGSFHASTADYIRMSDGARFQATNPSGSTLSAAAPAAFGFLTAAPPAITVNGSQLGPMPGTLGVVGGPVTISNGATLSAPGGTIHVTAVAGKGEVPVDPTNTSAFTATSFAPVSISGGAKLDVSDPVGQASGGSVFIRAGSLKIDQALADPLSSFTGILTASEPSSGGNAGTVSIIADSLTVRGGAQINSRTAGMGDAGNIVLAITHDVTLDGLGSAITAAALDGSTGKAGDVTLTAGGALTLSGGAHIGAATTGTGDGGTVTVTAGSLAISDNGVISSATLGPGDGGSVFITVMGALEIEGTSQDPLLSFTGILTGPNPTSTAKVKSSGNAGGVMITTDSLAVQGGAQVSSRTTGGDGGNITLKITNDATLDGAGSAVTAAALPGSAGKAGDVSVNATGALTLSDGAHIGAATTGKGNGGRVTVTSGSLAISDNGVITSRSNDASGNGGPIAIKVAGNLSIGGGAISSESDLGTGDGGTVTVTAGSLSIANDGQIVSSTNGPGKGGNVSVDVTGGVLIDTHAGISATAREGTESTGTGGIVHLGAGSLTILNGGVISTERLGKGQTGSISVDVAQDLLIDGNSATGLTGISASTEPGSELDAGNVEVHAGRVSISGGGQILASTQGGGNGGLVSVSTPGALTLSDSGSGIVARSIGDGDAGSIAVNATNLRMTDHAAISTESATANGGNITLEVGNLMYLTDGEITTSVAKSVGNGGNITIDPIYLILNHSSIIAQAAQGNGGNITIIANVYLPSADSIVSASSQLGLPGTVDIVGPRVDLNGTLAALPDELRNAAAVLRDSCSSRGGQLHSSLVEAGRGGVTLDPDAAFTGIYIAGRKGRDQPPKAPITALSSSLMTGLDLAVACN
jgi:filamentous hemagglutinin family protein